MTQFKSFYKKYQKHLKHCFPKGGRIARLRSMMIFRTAFGGHEGSSPSYPLSPPLFLPPSSSSPLCFPFAFSLFPLLSPGGVLIIDDYGWSKGCRDATDRYFEENPTPVLLHRIDESARIGIKQNLIDPLHLD